MSSLQVEELSGIHHSQGEAVSGSWTNAPGVHPFWELQNLARSEDKDGKPSLEWLWTSLSSSETSLPLHENLSR